MDTGIYVKYRKNLTYKLYFMRRAIYWWLCAKPTSWSNLFILLYSQYPWKIITSSFLNFFSHGVFIFEMRQYFYYYFCDIAMTWHLPNKQSLQKHNFEGKFKIYKISRKFWLSQSRESQRKLLPLPSAPGLNFTGSSFFSSCKVSLQI